MSQRSFPGAYIREVSYYSGGKRLTLQFETGRVLSYREVPDWVFKKLCASPSPRSFWEDSIRDEYSAEESKGAASSAARDALNDLFKS